MVMPGQTDTQTHTDTQTDTDTDTHTHTHALTQCMQHVECWCCRIVQADRLVDCRPASDCYCVQERLMPTHTVAADIV